MQAFAVVVALLAVAALGWALSWGARRILRRHGVPTDERSLQDSAAPGSADVESAGRDGTGQQADEHGTASQD